ncbi:glycosyltransferase family A protein [Roseofilum capinflatum]|uniref:Glycosyltransferase family 2 protein n=1 Tax=Roseofilum capinflatum BLCC-M114 TaxID=3022440 RepID=A0ABT7B8A3_9CYAN|nr:glycosyltransferase family 2 protein [Roseofilum capinflatum]MDJ1175408.1 glycosyltransferase family 2 protein [Roseofilum capinflatum BLCC-M114]
MSIIVQFFNNRQNIDSIIKSLRLTTAEEIIVIDDGSIDGSYQDWLKHLDRPNDFLLRCNDLFEVRTYDRAISMARGEFVCLLQDDDMLPDNNKWIEDALTLFEIYPDLIMLGGRDGIDTMMAEPNDSYEEQEYRQIGNIIECPGLHKLRIYSKPCYREPVSGIPFMFTMSVNRAPTFLRRTEFLKIGGINQKYAPFQFDDDEAGIRAWLSGYKVGFYACPFIRGFEVGGMSLYNRNKIKEQSVINIKQLYRDYCEHIANGHLQNLVDTANRVLISDQ